MIIIKLMILKFLSIIVEINATVIKSNKLFERRRLLIFTNFTLVLKIIINLYLILEIISLFILNS